MAQFARSGSGILSALLALCVLLLFGYLLFTDAPPDRSDQSLDPPIDLLEAELPFEQFAAEESLPQREQINEQEATAFVDSLAGYADREVITLREYQDQFVRPDSIIALPSIEQRVTTLKKLMMDPSLEQDTPITLTFTEETRGTSTLADLSETEEDHIAPITIVTQSGEEITAPLGELMGRDDLDPTAEVTQIKRRTRTENVTAKQLSELDIDEDQQMTVTIQRSTQEISIAEILGDAVIEDNSLLYLHRVTEEDRKGLWGIILAGLIDRFRAGMQIDGFANRDTVSVTIPEYADQPLPDGFSSFLGRVLYDKVYTSYVYNFKTNTMGNNPDLIYPGQQLIMISFSPDELRRIYVFFAEQRNESVETFAIGR